MGRQHGVTGDKELVGIAIITQSKAGDIHLQVTMVVKLDEILLGTNSVERHIAVSRVLAHLVAEGALGAVSTHDLDLAKSSDLAQSCRPVHFRETLHGREHGQQMSFDYKLREGVASTTNALKLLELVGLG